MKIRFQLSKADVKRAIEETKREAAYIQKKCDEFAKRLAQEGVLAAQTAANGYGANDTGDLISGITWQQVKPGLYKVSCFFPNDRGENYAWYVEFGTGAKGAAATEHPEHSLVGWDHDVNRHGEDGWFYPFGKSRKHKMRLNPATGKYQPWTDGEPAKPFMYDSRQHITDPEVVNRIMQEVFGS